MAAIGQSLAARLRLAMKDRGIPLWLNSPMTELITDEDAAVVGAVVECGGRPNQFVGDGVLALFGLSTNQETASRAC